MPGFADATGTMSSDDDNVGDAAREGAGFVLVHAAPIDSAPRAIVLDGEATIVGRAPPRGGIAISQNAASRVHAALRWLGPGRLWVSDLGSRNGVFVNGSLAKESAVVPGDVLRIGDAIFIAVAGDVRAHFDYHLSGAPARSELPPNLDGLVGGLSMGRLSRTLRALAGSDATVLVSGETGVGKELAARALHRASGRPGAFKAVNCAAIPSQLVESELFGHERGAFTGAVRAYEGIIRSAHQGTLLLDEIGDMSLEAQAKLLRVLETREVLPVGATRPVSVDVRIVCATHRDLRAAISAGAFRADLYARIAQREVMVPPLRARKEDLYALVLHYLASSGRHEEPSVSFMHRLVLHDWPFNVRELVGALGHAAGEAGDGPLRAAHLPATVGAKAGSASPALAPSSPPRSSRSDPEDGASRERRKGPTRAELSSLLARERGNMLAVSRALGRDPSQVYRWLRKYALDPDDFR